MRMGVKLKIGFNLFPLTTEMLEEFNRSLLTQRAQPFQTESQKYNYLLQLGIQAFLKEQNEIN